MRHHLQESRLPRNCISCMSKSSMSHYGMIAPNFNFTTNIDEVFPYLVSMSTVRSVSGFAMEVLKLEPFETVNHWPFLMERK